MEKQQIIEGIAKSMLFPAADKEIQDQCWDMYPPELRASKLALYEKALGCIVPFIQYAIEQAVKAESEMPDKSIESLLLKDEEIKNVPYPMGNTNKSKKLFDTMLAYYCPEFIIRIGKAFAKAQLAKCDKHRSQVTWCAYCGEEFPLDTVNAEQVGEHIATCEKHPLFQANKRITELEQVIKNIGGLRHG